MLDASASGEFEAWLHERCLEQGDSGDVRAMALEILEEFRLAQASPTFRAWLARGAPSDDAEAGGETPPVGGRDAGDEISRRTS